MSPLQSHAFVRHVGLTSKPYTIVESLPDYIRCVHRCLVKAGREGYNFLNISMNESLQKMFGT